MSVTHLKFKIEPETIPPFFRGKFLELIDPDSDNPSDDYVGWIHIREDGTIEIGEPGE